MTEAPPTIAALQSVAALALATVTPEMRAAMADHEREIAEEQRRRGFAQAYPLTQPENLK